jgi:hypothetical protein
VISSTCDFINLPFHQLFISSTFHLMKLLPFNQLIISSTCHSINLPFNQLALQELFISTIHFSYLPFHLIVISSIAIRSTSHFINLPNHQLTELSWARRLAKLSETVGTRPVACAIKHHGFTMYGFRSKLVRSPKAEKVTGI